MKKLVIITLLSFVFLYGCSSSKDENVNSNQNNVSNTIENQVVEETTGEETPVAETNEEIAVGKTIPAFEFTTLTGETINISDYEGKIIMLNFWATWCPYCVKEMPALEEMNAYDDVVVLALNAQESKSTVEKYINENPYDFDILLDEEGYFSNLFYISSLPSTFFINEEGILLGGINGMMTKEQMESIIQDIRDDKL
ncbi:MAG: redoxin domain-containing protein [Clostridia bacterium]|nr:redoxin domain-containing protein [Clostridia bacterium]